MKRASDWNTYQLHSIAKNTLTLIFYQISFKRQVYHIAHKRMLSILTCQLNSALWYKHLKHMYPISSIASYLLISPTLNWNTLLCLQAWAQVNKTPNTIWISPSANNIFGFLRQQITYFPPHVCEDVCNLEKQNDLNRKTIF